MVQDELRQIFAHDGRGGAVLRVDTKVGDDLIDLFTLRVIPSLTIVQRLKGFRTWGKNEFAPGARP